MQYLKSVLILISLALSGCSVNGQRITIIDDLCGCENKTIIKKQYIKQKCPKEIVLKTIPTYKITDYKDYDETYYLINKKQFVKSQGICHKLRQKIWLLEK